MLHPGNIGGSATIKTILRPAERAAAANFSLKSSALDRQNFDSLLLHIASGTLDAGTVTVDAKLQHSDTTTDGDFVDVETNPQNPLVAFTQINAADQDRFLEIDARGLKRYVRVVLTVAFGGGGAAIILVVDVLCGGARITPVAHA